MKYLVLTKWVSRQLPSLGEVKSPACEIPGVVTCEHLVGKTAVQDDYILCSVECDPATAAKIDQQGVGVVLMDRGTPNNAKITAANTRASSYGLAATIPPK